MTGEWQPIATAPKDGTKILGWKSGWVNAVGYRFTDEYKFWRWNAHNGRPQWESSEKISGYREDLPTHWMPLPDPPKEPA